MIDIFLLRHGHVPSSRPRRFLGQGDPALTREGRAQMADWSKFFARKPPTVVISSDLQRCRESAEIVLGPDKMSQLVLDSDFREVNLGVWDGLTVDEVKKRYPGAYQERGADMGGYVPEGGESFAMLQRRAMGALERVLRSFPSGDGSVLVVTHIGVSRVILARILQMPLAAIFRIEHQYSHAHHIRLTESRYAIAGLNLPLCAFDS